MSTNSLPLSSLTSNSPSITPPRSEDEEEIVEVVITPQLQNEQPKLAGMILNAISARNMVNIGAIFTVPESGIETYSNSRFKGVFWHGYEGRAGVLWLDAQEFRTLVSLNAADRVIASFREAHGLTVYSDVYLIIHNGDTLSDADRELIRSGQEALTEQLKIIAVSVNGLDAAADSILDLSLKFICKVNDPENALEETRNTYARMLMVIPGMNVCRTELVMMRCKTFRSLWSLLKSVKPEVVARTLPLNSTLFSRDRSRIKDNFREAWVESLFREICCSETDEVPF